MVHSKAFWQDVRLAYEGSDEPVVTIAKRFGIAKSTLMKRVRSEGWTMRRNRQPSQPVCGKRASMISRLYRTIDFKLAQLEARMQNENDLTVADHERETRAIGQLIRNFEKVSDLENDERDGSNAKRDGKSEHEPDAAQLDPHQLRQELAQRILRLREQRGTETR